LNDSAVLMDGMVFRGRGARAASSLPSRDAI